MDEVKTLLESTPVEAQEKSQRFIAAHGVDAFKKIRTLEVFNLEEAWQALKDCSNEELLLARMLIRDAYGMSLQEIADNLKKTGVERTRKAFLQLKQTGRRFNSAEVFQMAEKL